MSCGSRIFKSTDFPNVLETAKQEPWYRRAFDILCATLDKERRRQFQFELEKARQRGFLKNLDDGLLADIGMTREHAERESRKPF